MVTIFSTPSSCIHVTPTGRCVARQDRTDRRQRRQAGRARGQRRCTCLWWVYWTKLDRARPAGVIFCRINLQHKKRAGAAEGKEEKSVGFCHFVVSLSAAAASCRPLLLLLVQLHSCRSITTTELIASAPAPSTSITHTNPPWPTWTRR